MEAAKRILHIVSSMDRGGAETMIMSTYRKLDRKALQFDFVVHSPHKGDFEEEIQSLGGRIYKIASLGQSGPYRYIRSLMTIIKSFPYQAVHAHTDYQGGFGALAARLAGVKIRICHSHSTGWPRKQSFRSRITFKTLQYLIRVNATKYCSCSPEAGLFLFGKSSGRRKSIEIMKNAMDYAEFKKNGESDRVSIREELGIAPNQKIIGHVGRFSESKNQSFILDLLRELIKKEPNYTAVFAGDGEWRKREERKAKDAGLEGNVIFLGVREDIPRLMKAFDVFVFPSYFEGFGIVLLEAQAAGVPAVVSTAVPRSADLDLGLVSFMDLRKDSPEKWCERIRETAALDRPEKEVIEARLIELGYDITENVKHWYRLYEVS